LIASTGRLGLKSNVYRISMLMIEDFMANDPIGSSNAGQEEYWNGPATRNWSDRHEPIDKVFAGLTQMAIDLAAPQPGERVLDIGCGSGTTVLQLATRVGPQGHILGVDISQRSVEQARKRIAAGSLRQVEVMLADVSTHAFSRESFDLVFSRFGVMFFADPMTAFANVRKAIKPGGRLALAAFRARQENHWVVEPAAAVRDLLPPVKMPEAEEPGQFSWADPARVRRILEGAGFQDVALTPRDPDMFLASSGDAAGAADFAMHLGPAAQATLNASLQQRERLRSRLEEFFKSKDSPRGIVLPGAIWLITARA
jgi:SAM-dependent methyltransferase